MQVHTDERVVLLSEDYTPIGSVPKADVHTATTPLHLAFSCHLFDEAGRFLMTRRALTKRAWPGVWTNAVCGHPAPGESMESAIHRRLNDELGVTVPTVTSVLPEFRYRAIDAAGIVENEFCPVFSAVLHGAPRPHADEVAEWQWAEPVALLAAVSATPWAFSPWLVAQLQQLSAKGQSPWV